MTRDEPPLPKWVVPVAISDPGTDDASLVKINVAGLQPPAVKAGDLVALSEVRVQHWEMNGGRSGLSWSCTSMKVETSTGGARRGE